MKKIALVIGHSERKQGSRSPLISDSEWQLNKKIIHRLARKLLRRYDMVPYVIYRESTYGALPGQINTHGCDLVISHHMNAFSNPQANGSEVLFYRDSYKSHHAAIKFQKEITLALGTKDRGIKPIVRGQRGCKVLRETNAPCVLLEPIFITNRSDIVKFKEHYEDYLTGLETAILSTMEFLKGK